MNPNSLQRYGVIHFGDPFTDLFLGLFSCQPRRFSACVMHGALALCCAVLSCGVLLVASKLSACKQYMKDGIPMGPHNCLSIATQLSLNCHYNCHYFLPSRTFTRAMKGSIQTNPYYARVRSARQKIVAVLVAVERQLRGH